MASGGVVAVLVVLVVVEEVVESILMCVPEMEERVRVHVDW